MNAVFVDTSAYYALFDKTDKNNPQAINFLKTNTFPLVTTSLIVIETINLANARLGHEKAIKIGEKLYEGSLTTILSIVSEDEKKAWQIFRKYSDKNFSMIDCTSFAIMERLKIKKVFAFDVHFSQYGQFSVSP